MRQAVIVGILLSMIIYLIPFLTVSKTAIFEPDEPAISAESDVPETNVTADSEDSLESSLPEMPMAPLSIVDEEPVDAEAEALTFDMTTMVKVLFGDEVREMTLRDYLTGVVLSEMPASFEIEALKAQAVAARTFALKQKISGGKHENADVCTDSGCCEAFVDESAAREKLGSGFQDYFDKITAAVIETDGLVVTYNNQLIDATYFSCSWGETEAAVNVWGTDVPYLQSVASQGDEKSPRYSDTVEVPLTQFKNKILQTYDDAVFPADTADWIGKINRSDAGGVISIEIAGVSVRGSELRTLFGLRSICFTIGFSEDSVILNTKGYGHGVGMSQYGANAMAQEGKTFEEILTWYYTGTEVVPWGTQNPSQGA